MLSKQINIGLQIYGKILQFEHYFFISKYKTNFNEKRKKNVQIWKAQNYLKIQKS